jgi:hypothetical protein
MEFLTPGIDVSGLHLSGNLQAVLEQPSEIAGDLGRHRLTLYLCHHLTGGDEITNLGLGVENAGTGCFQ